jgi:hypothetical protein
MRRVAASVLFAVLAASVPATAGTSAGPACGDRDSRTIFQNELARVYLFDEGDSELTIVCNRRTRQATALEDDVDVGAYPVPGIDLEGPYVAVATADHFGDFPETWISLVDVRRLVRGRDTSRAFVAYSLADRTRRVARVGRVAVAPNGDVAWSTCPASQNAVRTDPRPNCVGPGAKVKVWVLRRGRRTSHIAARGTTIDPRSVRWVRGRVRWDEADAVAGTTGCAPRGARIIARTPKVEVYGARSSPQRLACSTATGEVFPLDNPSGNVYAFPSVAARGDLVAYAVNEPSDTDIVTTIRVASADRFESPDTREVLTRFEFAGATTETKVGRVVLSRRGGVAWTTCPASPSSVRATLHPTCLRAGARVRVWRWLAGERRPRAIARGNAIDPQSLRLSGSRLSWTERGRRRSAPLA